MADEDNVLQQLSKDFPNEEDLEKTDDVFGLNKPVEAETQTTGEEVPEDLKNRHVRRLESKLAKEREANIELMAREAARSEYEKFQEETKGLSVDDRVASIFTKDEVGKRSAEIFQSILNNTRKAAKEEALAELQTAQQAQAQEVTRYKDTIEESLEEIETEYNVDLSGWTEQSKQVRNSFLTLVQKLSPKDAEGNIESYADFDSAWEIFQDRMRKPNDRNKELASRGMVRSEAAGPTGNVQQKQHEQFLRDQGII